MKLPPAPKTPEYNYADLAAALHIPTRYAGGFGTFTDRTRAAKAARRDALRWCETFNPKGNGIRFTGPTGTGKTHLACAILMKLAEAGRPGRFVAASQLMSDLRKSFSRREDSPEPDGETILSELAETPVLLLDEFGGETAKDWVADRLYLLVNSRYSNLRPIIVTSNLALEEAGKRLGTAGERIASRLLECTDEPICLGGESQR